MNAFPLEFITAALRGPQSSSANEERWEEMKTLRALSSGTWASKASWQFQRVFILDAALAISIKYPVLSLRAILKDRFVWGGGVGVVQKPHPIGFCQRREIEDSESLNESCLLTMFIDSN